MSGQSVPKALLFVFTEPGEKLPESEFHDWYENEHISLRMAIPDIHTGTRFKATDGKKPTWAASYDLTALDTLELDAYKALGRERSDREKDVLARMEYLERRIYSVYEPVPVTVSPDFKGYTVGDGLVLVAVSLEVAPEHETDFNKWYDEEHIPMLSKVPGWLRTRRFVLKDSGASGKLVGTDGFKTPPKYLALHEYANTAVFEKPEWKAATSTEWRDRVFKNVTKFERRTFEVYKDF